MLKISKEKNIIKIENKKQMSYKKKDKIVKSLPNKEVVYVEWKPWKNGETPAVETLVEIIKPLIPKVKNWNNGNKWEKGDKGDKWDKWDTLKFSDLTIEERSSLEWPRWVPGMAVRLSDIYEWAWSLTGDYLVDEIVVYNNNTYFAKRRNKGVTPWTDDSIWQFLAPYTWGGGGSTNLAIAFAYSAYNN